MGYLQKGLLDRSLTDDEVLEFQQYARITPPPDVKKWFLYHPVCREVWFELGVRPPVKFCKQCLLDEHDHTKHGCMKIYCECPWSSLESGTTITIP